MSIRNIELSSKDYPCSRTDKLDVCFEIEYGKRTRFVVAVTVRGYVGRYNIIIIIL